MSQIQNLFRTVCCILCPPPSFSFTASLHCTLSSKAEKNIKSFSFKKMRRSKEECMGMRNEMRERKKSYCNASGRCGRETWWRYWEIRRRKETVIPWGWFCLCSLSLFSFAPHLLKNFCFRSGLCMRVYVCFMCDSELVHLRMYKTASSGNNYCPAGRTPGLPHVLTHKKCTVKTSENPYACTDTHSCMYIHTLLCFFTLDAVLHWSFLLFQLCLIFWTNV